MFRSQSHMQAVSFTLFGFSSVVPFLQQRLTYLKDTSFQQVAGIFLVDVNGDPKTN